MYCDMAEALVDVYIQVCIKRTGKHVRQEYNYLIYKHEKDGSECTWEFEFRTVDRFSRMCKWYEYYIAL